MLFPNILTNPIISKMQIFVTTHFRTLCVCWDILVRETGGGGGGFGWGYVRACANRT